MGDQGGYEDMSSKCIEAVTEFHAANGNAIDNPTQPGLALLRIGLITEELSETLTALRTRNIIDAADGLTDLLYVTYGAAVSYGLNLPDCFMASNEPPIDYVEHGSALTLLVW
jgi:predicted HAD superfamily Cof-like phosphohydrolase